METKITRRSSEEIREIFEKRGCQVVKHHFGHSYRAGGVVFIYAPGKGETSEYGFTFTPAEFSCFDGTGYDGRGRISQVFLVTLGSMVRATEAEFNNADPSKRIIFGDPAYNYCARFVDSDELAKSGLADMASAFSVLGI